MIWVLGPFGVISIIALLLITHIPPSVGPKSRILLQNKNGSHEGQKLR